MRRLLIAAVFSALLVAAETGPSVCYLAPYGPWELCPAIPWACASTTVNEYIVGFFDAGKAAWYSYTLRVTLQGQPGTITYRGSFDSHDNQFGWTTTAPLTIPGVVTMYDLSVKRGSVE